MQLECVKKRKVSADVIGHSNEEDLRHLSSDVEVPYSPGALPSADRFANFNYLSLFLMPSPPLDNIRVMVIVWRLRGNIIRTALCWVV